MIDNFHTFMSVASLFTSFVYQYAVTYFREAVGTFGLNLERRTVSREDRG